jgi:DNA/RNA endonuclease YhcR with UshA esterase domain
MIILGREKGKMATTYHVRSRNTYNSRSKNNNIMMKTVFFYVCRRR